MNDAERVRLAGNVHPLAQARYDAGAVPAATPANRLLLLLKRSPEQQAALTDYLEQVQNPHSPLYRQFLKPEEFGARYGLGDADVNVLKSWLASHGLTVAKVNKGRTAIEFSGTVGQVQEAFHTSIHRFKIDGVEHWANLTDPEIPAALAPAVAGVAASTTSSRNQISSEALPVSSMRNASPCA